MLMTCFLFLSDERNSSNVLENNINVSLSRVFQWLSLNSLSINPSKSKTIFFGNQSSDLNVYLNQSMILFVDYHKCLGVIDNTLCFEPHINTVVRNIYRMLRKLFSINLFLPTWVKTRLAMTSAENEKYT